jgi:large subunit ribosomal protein L9
MKVLLKVDVKKLGRKGDIVNVADGYALSALIPSGQAEVASEATVRLTDKQAVAKEKSEKEVIEKKQARVRKLKGQAIQIASKAEGETLFGSVGPTEVAQAIKDAYNEPIEAHEVVLPHHIKTIGAHTIVIDLGNGVKTEIMLNVVAM